MSWARPPLVPLTSPIKGALGGGSIASLPRLCPGCRIVWIFPTEDCHVCATNPFLADEKRDAA